MPNEDKTDRQLAELCYRVALDVLADKIDPVAHCFAAGIIDVSRGEKSMSDKISEIEALAELNRLAVQSEQSRATSAIGDFVTRLCDLPITTRSNSVKFRDYGILLSSACTLAVTSASPEQEPDECWEIFEEKIAFASNPLEDGDAEEFKRAIVAAFKAVVHRSDFSFVALDAQIRHERNLADLRFIRRKLGIRPRQASHTKISVG